MLLKSLFPLLLSLVVILSVFVQADEAARRKFLKECIDKELKEEYKELKLGDADFQTFIMIVNKQIDHVSLTDPPITEQKTHLKEIEEEVKKTMPKVPTETIDKMMVALKEKGMHCAKELPA
ncbi:MAG: hypothetical protein J3R72DRAFT_458579 [Linnemannia gamsii]|nr:MAG: hypothetical protein J3R72DRAFT_458579 [Linnemannia gamsii]